MLPPLRARKGLVLLGLAATCCTPVAGQTVTPLGSEYSLGGSLPGDQLEPSIAIGVHTGFLVWQDSQLDRNGTGISALRLDGNQNATGQAFQVNASALGDQEKPAVALLAGNGAVVAWRSTVNSSSHIVTRFLRADGTFATGDLLVDPILSLVKHRYTTNVMGFRGNKLRSLRFRITGSTREIRDRLSSPAVTALPDGGAVVAWSSNRRFLINTRQVVTETKTLRNGRTLTNDMLRPYVTEHNAGSEIFFQRFNADGTKAGPEVLANHITDRDQRNPAVTALADGRFVIVWTCDRRPPGLPGDTGETLISARLFSAMGEPLGDEFAVNSDAAVCASPSIAAVDGRITVAWNQFAFSSPSDLWDVYTRTLLPDSPTPGAAIRMNDYRAERQIDPQVAAAGGTELLTWTSYGQDGSLEGIFGRSLVVGSTSPAEFSVNNESASRQLHPTLASDGAERLVVVWTTFTEESNFDLRARRYEVLAPATEAASNGGRPTVVPETSERAALRVKTDASSGRLQLNWSAPQGVKYQLQVSTNLVSWADVGSPYTATGSSESVNIDTELPAAFYRLVRLP